MQSEVNAHFEVYPQSGLSSLHFILLPYSLNLVRSLAALAIARGLYSCLTVKAGKRTLCVSCQLSYVGR
jgi:hypothetical protein